jgi:Double zinc ribbon
MSEAVPFTRHYEDHSTSDGYRFAFYCERCGSAHPSSLRPSAAGFGVRLLEIGGDLVGGELGRRAGELGWDAAWLRGRPRAPARELARAAHEVAPRFTRCTGCDEWVCVAVCGNGVRGVCARCATPGGAPPPGGAAGGPGEVCPACGAATGDGRYCGACGTPLAAAPEPGHRFCTGCGTAAEPGARFCGWCGAPAA